MQVTLEYNEVEFEVDVDLEEGQVNSITCEDTSLDTVADLFVDPDFLQEAFQAAREYKDNEHWNREEGRDREG